MGEMDISNVLANLKPMREIVYDYLRMAILQKKIVAGHKMIEREIAENFKVSRTPVREALQKLETEGYLERKQGKSYHVRLVDAKEVEEAFLLRSTLEPMMVKSSVEHLLPKDIKALQAVMKVASEANAKGDYATTSKKLLEFDSILLNVCNLPKFAEILRGLQSELRRFRISNLTGQERRSEAVKEHTLILEAIIAKDAELAAKKTHEHIQNSHDGLRQFLENTNTL